MATIKSYTSLAQSKKLAEFLPLESADMRYHTVSHYNPYPCDEIIYTVDFDRASGIDIPCWSLAALLRLMPKEINVLGTIYSINIHTKNEKWLIDYKCNNEEFVGVYSNIFLDACVKMILKLHEQNLL